MGKFFGWVFGIGWLTVGAGAFIGNEWLSGAALALIGLSALPHVHEGINNFLRHFPRNAIFKKLITGHGTWSVAMSLLAIMIAGLSAGASGVGDIVGMSILLLLSFFIFKTIRDKIDRFAARAMGSPLEEPPSSQPVENETPAEAGIRMQLNRAKDQESILQLKQLRRKFDAFQQMLEMRFEQQELTYAKYRQIVEDSYLACLDNLQKITEAWAGISGVDIDSINRQLDNNPSEALRQTLSQRMDMVRQTQVHIDQLRSANEMAMTRLDEITMQLSRIQTRKGHAPIELNHSLKELSKLAQGAQMYDMKR